MPLILTYKLPLVPYSEDSTCGIFAPLSICLRGGYTAAVSGQRAKTRVLVSKGKQKDNPPLSTILYFLMKGRSSNCRMRSFSHGDRVHLEKEFSTSSNPSLVLGSQSLARRIVTRLPVLVAWQPYSASATSVPQSILDLGADMLTLLGRKRIPDMKHFVKKEQSKVFADFDSAISWIRLILSANSEKFREDDYITVEPSWRPDHILFNNLGCYSLAYRTIHNNNYELEKGINDLP